MGVVAVSITALLFVGCGDTGPKMSPAQKELQKKTCDQLNAKKKEIESQKESFLRTVEEWRAAGRGAAINPSTESSDKELQINLEERAKWGC